MKKIFYLLIAVFQITLYAEVKAQSVSQFMCGTDIVVTESSASETISLSSPGAGYFDTSLKNIVEVYVDYANTDFIGAYEVTIDFKIELSGHPTESDKTINVPVVVNYDPMDPNQAQTKFFVEDGYYDMTVTVEDVVPLSTPHTLPTNICIRLSNAVERLADFTSNYSQSPQGLNVTDILDQDCNGNADAVNVSWLTLSGAEYYELEYTFVNNYSGSSLQDNLNPSELAYDFNRNSVRVEINDGSTDYLVPYTYDSGVLFFRLRGVGFTALSPQIPVYGVWSSAATDDFSNVTYLEIDGVNSKFNWQVTTNFAENGKRKQVMYFHDGINNERQLLSRIDEDDPDNSYVLAAEKLYDRSGRPAVQILPAPIISDGGCNPNENQVVLKYYPVLNMNNAGIKYSEDDFDPDPEACAPLLATTLGNTSGSGLYYSTSNPLIDDKQAFVPDAGGYPFSQVRYTKDRSGRVKSQGGVGPVFQLTSGHETRFYYGQPNQLELDRLFGSEVGPSVRYKKEIQIDPNGQTSVTFKDQTGQVIATALAGVAPDIVADSLKLNSLPEALSNAEWFRVSLLGEDQSGNSDINFVSEEEGTIELEYALLVSYEGPHTFEYGLDSIAWNDDCLGSEVCFNCIYDIEMSIVDECGKDLLGEALGLSSSEFFTMSSGRFIDDGSGNISGFTTGCSSQIFNQDAFNPSGQVLTLPVGSYMVSKKLKLNGEALEFYIDEYINNPSTCVLSIQDYISGNIPPVDTSGCSISCLACEEALGNMDVFISNGYGDEIAYNYLLEECRRPCTEVTLCDVQEGQMLIDMSPEGQYGTVTYEEEIATSTDNLSVFNEDNILSPNVSSEEPNITTGMSNWRHPFYPGISPSNQYVDELGVRVKIFLDIDPFGAYQPSVYDESEVYYDPDLEANYIYPQNLGTLSDFLFYWESSWAKSLLVYHPEYCYYAACLHFDQPYDGFLEPNFNSEDFDRLLYGADDFQSAIDASLIIESPPGVYSIDFFDNTGTTPADPFVLNSVDYGNFGQQVQTAFENYYTVNANSYSAIDIALFGIQCPGETVVVDCNAVLGGNMATRDNEWLTIRGTYLSIKQEAQLAYQRAYSLNNCEMINECIGETSYYPTSSFLADYYYEGNSGCSSPTKQFYATKEPRFIAPENAVPSANEVEYIYNQQTGECPIAIRLRGILTELAVAGDLNSVSTIPLNNLTSFAGFYTSWQESSTLIVDPPPHTFDIYSITNGDLLEANFIDDNANSYCFSMEKTSNSPFGSFNEITIFQEIFEYQQGPPNTFSMVVGGYVGGDLEYDTLSASVCIDLTPCSFELECDNNQFGIDLQLLMTALATTGLLESTALNLELNYAQYLPEIRNVFPGVSNALRWNNTGDVFSIYDNSDATAKLVVTFDSYVSDPPGFDNTDFDDILYFDSLKSTGDNGFIIKAYDLNDERLAEISGTVLFEDSPVSYGVPIGECDFPLPIDCQSDPHLVREDFQELVNHLFGVYQGGGTNYALMQSFYLSNLLESYIPATVSNSTGDIQTINPVAGRTNEILTFTLDGCDLVLNHAYSGTPTRSYSDLDSWDVLNPAGEVGPLGSYTDFYILADFAIGGTTYNDTIYGSSCWPFAICEECETVPVDTTITYDNCTAAEVVSYSPGLKVNGLPLNSTYTDISKALGIPEDDNSVNFVALGMGGEIVLDFNMNVINGPGDDLELFETTWNNNPCNVYEESAEVYLAQYSGPWVSLGVVCHDGLFDISNADPTWTHINLIKIVDVSTTAQTENGYDVDGVVSLNGCGPLTNDCLAMGIPIIPFVEYVPYNPCADYILEVAAMNSEMLYTQYIDSVTGDFINKYRENCMQVSESFEDYYPNMEYHNTLYYYDQAGNLVKTVPPEGVEPLPITSVNDPLSIQISQDRTASTQTVFTYHRMASRYEYNSLNQLTTQSIPDHDKKVEWSVDETNGLRKGFVADDVQFIDETNGFIGGYYPSGQTNRGLLYRTTDGGYTWNRINGLIAEDINKARYTATATGNFYNGYAVGENGLIIQTKNSGSSWDLLNLQSLGITEALQDVAVFNQNDFIAVGNEGRVVRGANGTFTLPIGVGSDIDIDAIEYLEDESFAYAAGVDNLENRGQIYQITATDVLDNSVYSGFDYNHISKNKTGDIVYVVGDDGRFAKVELGNGSTIENIRDRPSNDETNFADIRASYFVSDEIGVAIIEDFLGLGRINTTENGGLTWNPAGNINENADFVNIEASSEGTGAVRLIIAGTQGEVRDCYLFDSGAFTAVALGNFQTLPLPNFTSSWARLIDNNLHVFLGTDDGMVYYSENAQLLNSTWTSFIGNNNQLSIDDMIFRYTDNATFKFVGVLFGSDKQLTEFKISPDLVSEIESIPLNQGVSSYLGITEGSGSNTISAVGLAPTVPNSTPQTKLISFSITTSNVSASSNFAQFQNLEWASDFTDVLRNNGMIYICGKNGRMASTSAGEAWTDHSSSFIPRPFTDVQFYTKLNGEDIELDQAIAAGENGTIFYFDFNKDTSPGFPNGTWRMLNTGFHEDILALDIMNGEIVVSRQGKRVSAGVIDTANFDFNVNTSYGSQGTIVLDGLGEIEDMAAADDAGIVFVGSNGLYQYADDMGSTPQPLNTTNEDYFLGVAVLAFDSTRFIGVGKNTEMRTTNQVSSVSIIEKYPTPVESFHFSDIYTGHVVLEGHNIRKTISAGLQWEFITPTYSVAGISTNDLYTNQLGNALIVGDNSFVAEVVGSSASLEPQAQLTGNIVDIEFSPDTPTEGFIVGNNGLAKRISYESYMSNAVISSMPTYTGSYPSKSWVSAHAFTSGYAMVVGENAAYFYRDGIWAENASPESSTFPSAEIKDVFFRDDYNGYLVGSYMNGATETGMLLRSTGISISPNGPSDIAWMEMPLTDNVNITDPVDVVINHIEMPTKYDGVFSGVYDSGFTNSTIYPYTRHFHDESEEYSTHFYYDKLGRLVLSQNTKQHNLINTQGYEEYAYTIYDELGRIAEVGVIKDDNNTFTGIFGSMVGFAFNANVIDDVSFGSFLDAGTKKEVTRTYYDEPFSFDTTPVAFNIEQRNLRNRVATTTYCQDPLTPLSSTEIYDNALHYSYDIHGNVAKMYTEVGAWSTLNDYMRFKTVEYDYDLVSGNVNEVRYQANQDDQFTHRYTYDAENRIKTVMTSSDGTIWDQDGKYFYYDHGPLAQLEIGQDQIQGLDYAYTIQGWLKGINSNTLDVDRDMGHDGKADIANANASFAQDVYGLSLGYFTNDYKPVDQANHWNATTNRFVSSIAGSDLQSERYNLYNGNIGNMVNTTSDPATQESQPLGNAYVYDQLQRLNQARSYENLEASTNTWGTGSTYDGMYENTFLYDDNGNIETQLRKNREGVTIDSLQYRYDDGTFGRKRNRLYHVDDDVISTAFDDDIDDMGTFVSDPNFIATSNNYMYDELGQLVSDSQEGIGVILWRNDGKISNIVRDMGGNEQHLDFTYSPSGERLSKEVFDNAENHLYSNYYIRDASGNVMAVYKVNVDTANQSTNYTVAERHIYGSDRLGMYAHEETVYPVPPVSTAPFQPLWRGHRQYELKNHLGNVTSVVNGHKVAVESTGVIDHYNAQIVAAYDYSPFGVIRKSFEPDYTAGSSGDANPLAADFRWCMDGGGTEANGTGHDAALYSITNTANRNAEADKALRSNGASGSYMEIADDASFDFGSNDFTVGIWVRKEAAPTSTVNVIAVGKWNNDAQMATNEWCLNVARSSGTARPPQFRIAVGGTVYTAQGNSTLSNSWHHLVGVREGTNIKFYLNGTLVQTTSVGTGAVNNVGRKIRIGRSDGSLRTRARFDEFVIYQHALSAGEISDLYTSTCEDLEGLPGEEIAGAGYSYGFNGMEKDDEISGSGNSYTAEFWQYDPRIGRWFTIDPKTSALPHESPYVFSGNNPIFGSDPDGDICVPCVQFIVGFALDVVDQMAGELLDGASFAAAWDDVSLWSAGFAGVTSAASPTALLRALNSPVLKKVAHELIEALVEATQSAVNSYFKDEPINVYDVLMDAMFGKVAGDVSSGLIPKVKTSRLNQKIKVQENIVDRQARVNGNSPRQSRIDKLAQEQKRLNNLNNQKSLIHESQSNFQESLMTGSLKQGVYGLAPAAGIDPDGLKGGGRGSSSSSSSPRTSQKGKTRTIVSPNFNTYVPD